MCIKRVFTNVVLLATLSLPIGFSTYHRADALAASKVASRIAGEEILIGVVVAQSGHHAEQYGFPMLRGFELARDEINDLGDFSLVFVTEDDESSSDGAKAAVQRLVDQKVPAIVGLANLIAPKGGSTDCSTEQGHRLQFCLFRSRTRQDWRLRFPNESRNRYKRSKRRNRDSREAWLQESGNHIR